MNEPRGGVNLLIYASSIFPATQGPLKMPWNPNGRQRQVMFALTPPVHFPEISQRKFLSWEGQLRMKYEGQECSCLGLQEPCLGKEPES